MLMLTMIGVSAITSPKSVSAQRSTLTFSYLNKNTATTSLTTLGLGALSATSTIIVPTPMADQVNVLVQDVSTSTSVLNWVVQYSDENNCDTASSTGATFSYTNPCDWFTETISSSSEQTSLTQESPTAVHQWTPGIIGTSTKYLSIPNVGANYVRVTFYSSTATSSIWALASVKGQVQ